MLTLLYQASKFSFFLMLVLICPVFPILENLLSIWLPTVPEYTEVFCKLVLIYCLIDTLTIPIWTAIEATGKIKVYQLVVGLFFILYIPSSYLLLKHGCSASSILWLKIGMSIAIHSVRLIIVKSNISQFSYRIYITKVIIPIMLVCCSSIILQSMLIGNLNEYIVAIFVFIVTSISVMVIGLSSNERQVLTSLITAKFKK